MVALGREIVALAGGLLAVLSVALVVAIFAESLIDMTINIQPLSVPEALSRDGLSPEVVALALRDRMNALAETVRRERGFSEGTEIMDPEELPDVTVPSVGLSAQALAADLRAFFKIQNRLVVSGEIVSRDDAYDLTLRLNGRAFFHSPKGLPRARLDDVLAQGAQAAVGVTQPYVGAVVAFDDHDDASAIALCDGIIARGGGTPTARFARLLRAQSLERTGRREEAVKAYRELVAIDPKDIAAHDDLGKLLAALGQPEAAAAEYRKAIAVDGTLAFPHEHLARAYLALGRPEDAVAEVRKGAEANPGAPYWHFVLARVLRRAGRGEEAVQEFRRAAALDPHQPWVRREIGAALREAGLPDEAAALDPGSAEACGPLASPPANALSAPDPQGRGEAPPAGCGAAAARPGIPD